MLVRCRALYTRGGWTPGLRSLRCSLCTVDTKDPILIDFQSSRLSHWPIRPVFWIEPGLFLVLMLSLVLHTRVYIHPLGWSSYWHKNEDE